MTSEELAGYVGLFIKAAQGRVLGVGRDQYDQGDGQKFETMPLGELFDYAHEELQDMAAYVTMLQIRLWRLQGEIARRQAQAALAELTRASVEGLVREHQEAEERVETLTLQLNEMQGVLARVAQTWWGHGMDEECSPDLQQAILCALAGANEPLDLDLDPLD